MEDAFNNLILRNSNTTARPGENTILLSVAELNHRSACDFKSKSDQLRVDSGSTSSVRKKLWLHIGHPKYGSTFIQSTFACNHVDLKQLNISYPVDFQNLWFL